MEHKIYMNYIHPSSLLRQLSDLWKADQMCDAVITVDKIIVAKAHKVVLLAISPKLKADSAGSSQSPILDVSLPAGVGHNAVHAFLQYLYEGYLILTEQTAIQLCRIAEFLQIKCLENCCSDYLESLGKSVIVLDEDVKEVKTEEFTHVRTSSVEDILKKRLNDGGEVTPSTPKRKKHSSEVTENRESISSIPASQPSPRSSQSSFQAPDVSPLRGHHPSQLKTDSQIPTGFEMSSSSQIEIKTEPTESSDTEHQDTSWNNSSQMLDPNSLSSVVKEEVEDSVDQIYYEVNQDTSSGDMWLSGELDNSLQFSQAAPGPSHMSVPQRTMTQSLSQMRAQQSIKRSIQSSVSAARKARNIEQAQEEASTSGDDPSMQEEPEGSESQEKWCSECGRRYNSHVAFLNHIPRFHKIHKHTCDVCHKTFATKFERMRHQNTHLANKPFTCKVCGKQYSAKESLVGHIRKYHTTEEN